MPETAYKHFYILLNLSKLYKKTTLKKKHYLCGYEK